MSVLAAVKQVAANASFAHALDQLDSRAQAVKVPLVVGLRIFVRFRRIVSEIRCHQMSFRAHHVATSAKKAVSAVNDFMATPVFASQ